jgi:hypothetical protein
VQPCVSARRGHPGIPASDEELADRLTELLKPLDAVAEPLPRADVLRQTIDDAAEPLGLLLGYFAGGIDKHAGSHKTAQRKAERMRPAPGPAPTPAREDPAPALDVKPSLPPLKRFKDEES